MCDYSLQAVKSRPAVVGDKLVVFNFGNGSSGFADGAASRPDTAVCLLPGTEIAIEPAVVQAEQGFFKSVLAAITPRPGAIAYETAIFRQTNKENPYTHHDMLEFPDGQTCMLTRMPSGIKATVLQLPAAPKTLQEAKEQERLAIVA